MSSVNKRLLKELKQLTIEQNSKNLLENDYLISFDEHDLTKVYAIIKCPNDSLYRHKFIRLDFDIPDDYPHSPPNVSFVNYDGSRIHPILYGNQRVCCTILNTWPSLESDSKNKLEAWTSSFGIETVILTISSFLDNEPYKHEANAPNNDSYNTFVLFKTWNTCLFKYLENPQPELFTQFISSYICENISQIMDDLQDYNEIYPPNAYNTRCFYIGYYTLNYNIILDKLIEWYNFLDEGEGEGTEGEGMVDRFGLDTTFNCNICFDTSEYPHFTTLSCQHKFHNKCILEHINNNGNICSLCRTDINTKDLKSLSWIINPETKRLVKIGSRTYYTLFP